MDKTTKVLLAIIAIGLWMNVLNPWVRPVKAEAAVLQSDYYLLSIDSTLSSMESDLSSISNGLCLAVRGGSTFSERRWYPPVEAAKGSLSWVFRAKQPESVRTGP